MAANKKFVCLLFLQLFGAVHGLGDVTHSMTCSLLSGWRDLSMEEYLSSARLVVYGRTKEHRAFSRNGGSFRYIDATFEVFCIFKGGEDFLPTEIVISEISPRNGCSDTKKHMQVGEEAIVALKPSSDGKYEYDEVMPLISATYAASRTNLMAVAGICGMQDWSHADDATQSTRKCPICSNANFSEAAMAADGLSSLNPCLINGVLFGNDTDICKTLIAQQGTGSQTCIPGSYANTCTQITITVPTSVCQCRNKGLSGDFQETDTSSSLMASGKLLIGMVSVAICALRHV